jgi:transposase
MEETRKPTYDELLVENAQLKQEIARQAERIVALETLVVELNAKIDTLTKMLFGKKSEKSKKSQKQEPPETESPVCNEPLVDEPKQRRKKNGGGGRNSFPSNIPRRNIHVSLSPDECCCPKCGKDFVPMGVEITEILNFIPMVLEVLRFIRQRMKAACACFGNKIIIAEPPVRTIDKGSVSTEFIAAVLVNKYCDHLPIHRQVGRLLKSAKVAIAESSVCRWRDQVADQLEPLVKRMKSEIKKSYCINTDASPAPVRLPEEKNRIATGNAYVYIGGDDAPYNVFDVQPNQSAKPIYEFLEGYSNCVQCDAHGNYDSLFAPKKPVPGRSPPQEVGCHAHCRRYFVNAQEDEPEWVKRFVIVYKELYKIEKEIKGETVEERYHCRQNDSVPLLDKLFDLCRECSDDTTILPKSRLGQACAYARSNEVALRRYCTDGRLAIDNNVSERTLREFVIGRKNWLFFGSPESARRSAMVMSVLSSARRQGLNEWDYLVDMLYRLSDLTSEGALSDLLPDRWQKSPVPPTEVAALVAARVQGNNGFACMESLKPLSAKNRKI